MGCIIKAYREWQLSGDDEMLKTMYPHIKKALAFAWTAGEWDINKDGVMEGSQHNTMDINYLGPNPQMAAWYLGALRAGESACPVRSRRRSKNLTSRRRSVTE